MAIFVVYASIRLATAVTDEVIAAVDLAAEAVDAEDDPCVWRNKANPNVVQLSVSVEAGNAETALRQVARSPLTPRATSSRRQQ